MITRFDWGLMSNGKMHGPACDSYGSAIEVIGPAAYCGIGMDI